MSRIGKNPLRVPKEVKVKVDSFNINIEGPKGKIDTKIPHGLDIVFKEDHLLISRTHNSKQNRSNHGTMWRTLDNHIVGVTKGHKKELEIQGVGFRSQLQGKKIVFNLGLSHPIEFDVPESVKVAINNQTQIVVEGIDKMQVGLTAMRIRSLKPVEPYKGKGVRYTGEVVRRKQGKSVTK